jgi:hypothetical protein
MSLTKRPTYVRLNERIYELLNENSLATAIKGTQAAIKYMY